MKSWKCTAYDESDQKIYCCCFNGLLIRTYTRPTMTPSVMRSLCDSWACVQNKAIFMFLKSIKNTKFVVTTWVLSSSKCTKLRFRPELSPGTRWGAYSAPGAKTPSWWVGGWLPFPKTPSRSRSSGLSTLCLRHSNHPPPSDVWLRACRSLLFKFVNTKK